MAEALSLHLVLSGNELRKRPAARLVSGLPSSLRETRAFGLLQVVIDDSGRGQERDPAFVLAGYIARVKNWEVFADDWQAALAEKPRIKYLKGSEAYRRKGQFRGWSEDRRDKKLIKLVSLIHKYAPLSVTLAVNGRAFEILKATKGSLRNVYPLAIAALTTQALHSPFSHPIAQACDNQSYVLLGMWWQSRPL